MVWSAELSANRSSSFFKRVPEYLAERSRWNPVECTHSLNDQALVLMDDTKPFRLELSEEPVPPTLFLFLGSIQFAESTIARLVN